MTQTDIPAWSLTFQLKLMAALDAAWASIETTDDPAVIRRARDKARAVGELAAMARKVALITPAAPRKPPRADLLAGLGALASVAPDPTSPTQADHARAALEKLKRAGRGRL